MLEQGRSSAHAFEFACARKWSARTNEPHDRKTRPSNHCGAMARIAIIRPDSKSAAISTSSRQSLSFPFPVRVIVTRDPILSPYSTPSIKIPPGSTNDEADHADAGEIHCW
jgi:hypothetical protein